MKIMYAIQATGNGHISRAIQLYPFLSQLGEVDFFLSGSNSALKPSIPIKYRSQGVSLYFKECGGLNVFKTAKDLNILRLKRDIRDLPVEKYDVIINDFDFITAKACQLKGIASIQFGHQASFLSPNTPRPERKNFFGELILQKYAPAEKYIGLHFQKYDKFIFDPIIKNEVQNSSPLDKGHITVYLPSYRSYCLTDVFQQFPDYQFHLFSFDTKSINTVGNIRHFPIDNQLFSISLKNCHGMITGGGFESPAEALYLGKKLLSIPIKRHYEQQCNAAALRQLGVMTAQDFNAHTISQWLDYKQPNITIHANDIVDTLDRLIDDTPINYPKTTYSFIPI